MPVDETIRTRSQDFAGLSALVSTRVWPEKYPVGNPTLPYLTYGLVSTVEPFHTFSTPTDFEREDEYRFRVWADDHDEARSISKQVILAFHGYADGTTCFIFDSEEEVPEDEDRVFHHVLSFRVVSENDNS